MRFRSGDIELAGTRMTPHGEGPHPAIIFMHGGLGLEFIQTRWQFYHFADQFARQGIAALIYDKRGHGASGGRRSDEAPFQALADDALAALQFLKAQPELDQTQMGIWAISQGGWPAPLAASQSRDVAFLIIVSGGGAAPADEWVFDTRVALQDADSSEAEIDRLMPHLSALRQQINRYYRTGEGYAQLVAALEQAQT